MTNRQRLAAEAFLLVLVGGGVLWAQAPRDNANAKANDPVPDVIRAREFQMVDKGGKVLAGMKVNPAMDGPIVYGKGFHVVDDTGYVRAAMRLDGSEGGPDITFWSKDHKRTVAELSLNENDRPLLIFSDKIGKHQITVMTSDYGSQILLDGKELVPTDAAKK